MTTTEELCTPECGCVCGHDNAWHALATEACRSYEVCNCYKFRSRACDPSCPNGPKPPEAPKACLDVSDHREHPLNMVPAPETKQGSECRCANTFVSNGVVHGHDQACLDLRNVELFLEESVPYDPEASWTPGVLKSVARAYLALRAENEGLKRSTRRRRDEIIEVQDERNALRAEVDKERRLKEEARKRLDGIVEENQRNYDAIRAELAAAREEIAEIAENGALCVKLAAETARADKAEQRVRDIGAEIAASLEEVQRKTNGREYVHSADVGRAFRKNWK